MQKDHSDRLLRNATSACIGATLDQPRQMDLSKSCIRTNCGRGPPWERDSWAEQSRGDDPGDRQLRTPARVEDPRPGDATGAASESLSPRRSPGSELTLPWVDPLAPVHSKRTQGLAGRKHGERGSAVESIERDALQVVRLAEHFLDAEEHSEYHQIGRAAFDRKYLIDLPRPGPPPESGRSRALHEGA